MSGLSVSHNNLYLTSTSTFDDICLDYLYHTIDYIWHLLQGLATCVRIIFIILYLKSNIYYQAWRPMSGISLSHYSLHLTFTTTFDDICLDYLYHSMSYIWHLLSRWRLLSGLSLSHYSFNLTYTSTFDAICLDYLYHSVSYLWNWLTRLTTYVRIIIITL